MEELGGKAPTVTLKGMGNPQEKQQSKLTLTLVGSQKLSHQAKNIHVLDQSQRLYPAHKYQNMS